MRKVICSFPKASHSWVFDALYREGRIELECVPQGTIAERLRGSDHDVLFLCGIGEVFPYIRSHNVLNNLQSTAKDKPTVLFFPGEYRHSLAQGASLELFGLLHDDKYYRAFNIFETQV